MLREIGPVKQVRGEPRKRWFASPDCDLVVWYGKDDAPIGFHLSYDKQHREHALVWHAPGNFQHTGIDSGETHPLHHKATPIHIADGVFEGTRIVELFRGESAGLPGELVELVLQKLGEYGARAGN